MVMVKSNNVRFRLNASLSMVEYQKWRAIARTCAVVAAVRAPVETEFSYCSDVKLASSSRAVLFTVLREKLVNIASLWLLYTI